MTTLLTKTGTWTIRRCDARCHDAKREECECICGGMNHGVGYAKAIENTHNVALGALKEAGLVLKPHQLPLATGKAYSTVTVQQTVETRALARGGVA